jgi:hypothetical protein
MNWIKAGFNSLVSYEEHNQRVINRLQCQREREHSDRTIKSCTIFRDPDTFFMLTKNLLLLLIWFLFYHPIILYICTQSWTINFIVLYYLLTLLSKQIAGEQPKGLYFFACRWQWNSMGCGHVYRHTTRQVKFNVGSWYLEHYYAQKKWKVQLKYSTN